MIAREIGFLGGVLPRGSEVPEGASWSRTEGDRDLFLRSGSAGPLVFDHGPLAVLVRGWATPPGSSGPTSAEGVAALVADHYRKTGDLPTDGLEGSFGLALLDAREGRALLYRNLVGAGFTYLARTPGGGLVFGSNLADVVRLLASLGRPASARVDVLPSFFLYRFVPGRATLFEGVERLMPGELARFDAKGLDRSQRTTFADLRGDRPDGRDAADRVEEALSRAMADASADGRVVANTLSGGVDSTFLQVAWNRLAEARGSRGLGYTIVVDHPRTAEDRVYARTAAEATGTDQVEVPADAPYADYLLESIASTGEPPNHVQSAYFPTLGRAMSAGGVSAALCGEGADSLFGIGTAGAVQVANLFRMVAPLGPMRKLGASVAGSLGMSRVASYLLLADRLGDFTDPDHPVNQVAAFADWPASRACFGDRAIAEASASRLALCDLYRVPPDPMERMHASGFLGEAMDSASLWTTMLNRQGVDLVAPFLDSRVMRLALSLPRGERFPFRDPKGLLKRALARRVPREMAYRGKLGFGQPIFAWMAPGGQLRPLVDAIGDHDFVDPSALAEAKARPNWFLYSLLCYDLWHKLFIVHDPARPDEAPRPSGAALAPGTA